jgi:hypothetical protein
LNPLGLFLEPPGPLLTHPHTVYTAYSERLPTRLNPLAERACFPQVYVAGQDAEGNAVRDGPGVCIGLYPIVTFQYSSTTLYQFTYHIR